MTKYTDAQIRDMTQTPWRWPDQLRREAKRRKLAVSSVTPLPEVVHLLRASLKTARKVMTALLVLVAVVGCRPHQWEGIPGNRTCGSENARETTCIADGKVYMCVRDGNRMLCSRDTVEIKCANVVNVETVCPDKPAP